MAIPSYPIGLPLALREGYKFNPVNRINRTEMVSGRARQRVEFTNVPQPLQLSWIVTSLQAAILEAWCDQVVGAGWFTMRVVTPLGFEDLEIRLMSTIDGGELVGRYDWKYTAEAELKFKPALPPGWVDFPEYILNSDILDIALNDLWPLNEWQIYADVADLAINQDWPKP